MNTAQLKKQYKEQIAPALQKQFNYSSAMQVPVLKKIVINQGLGDATQDKKLIEVAERMYEFLEKLVRVSLPRIRDFKGIESKFDGRGNYTLGITEQIIFPEINIDQVDRIQGMNITFVTSAKTDEEGYALLKGFGLPFKNAKND